MRYSDIFEKKSSRILLGTAYFDDGISKEDAFKIMDKFRDMGGTHIDTARLYADGRAEAVVGEWVKKRNATDMHISTKGGYPHADTPDKVRISESEIRGDLEESLKALGVDSIGFYWLHRDDESIPAGEIIEMMNRLIKEGKIRSFGASNWTTSRIDEAQKYAKAHNIAGFSASQIRFNPAYNVTERSGLVGMDETEFAYYKANNMPVVAYSSQAKGFFSKLAEQGEEALSEKAKLRYMCDINLKKVETIKSLAEKHNCSVAALICGAFCSFDVPEVFPVIGSRNIGQLTDSLNGADIRLTDDEIKAVFAGVI